MCTRPAHFLGHYLPVDDKCVDCVDRYRALRPLWWTHQCDNITPIPSWTQVRWGLQLNPQGASLPTHGDENGCSGIFGPKPLWAVGGDGRHSPKGRRLKNNSSSLHWRWSTLPQLSLFWGKHAVRDSQREDGTLGCFSLEADNTQCNCQHAASKAVRGRIF